MFAILLIALAGSKSIAFSNLDKLNYINLALTAFQHRDIRLVPAEPLSHIRLSKPRGMGSDSESATKRGTSAPVKKASTVARQRKRDRHRASAPHVL